MLLNSSLSRSIEFKRSACSSGLEGSADTFRLTVHEQTRDRLYGEVHRDFGFTMRRGVQCQKDVEGSLNRKSKKLSETDRGIPELTS